jgi:hypothetical protein
MLPPVSGQHMVDVDSGAARARRRGAQLQALALERKHAAGARMLEGATAGRRGSEEHGNQRWGPVFSRRQRANSRAAAGRRGGEEH